MTPSQSSPAVDQRDLNAAILASCDSGIIAVSAEGIVLGWNPGAERIFGFGASEVVGQPMFRLNTDHGDETADILERVRHGERIRELSARPVRKDGTAVRVALRISRLEGLEGLAPGACFLVRELASEEPTAAALRWADDRLRIAKDAAGLGIHDYNVKTHEIDWDDRAHEIWGTDPNKIVDYQTFFDGVHPDDRETVATAVATALRPGGTGHYECDYRVIHRSTGVQRWVHATGHVFFENGEAVRLVGTLEDVTSQRKRHEQLQLVTNNVAAMLSHCDRDHRFLFVNQPYAERFGLTPDQIIGKHISEVVGVEAYESFRHRMDEVFARGEILSWEAEVPYPKGTRYIKATYAPKKDERGEVESFVAVIEDITDRRSLQDQLDLALRIGRIGPYEWSADKQTLRWHPELFAICGCDPRSFRPTPEAVLAMVHPEDREEVLSTLRDTSRSTVEVGFRLRGPDGRERYLSSRSQLQFDEQGKPSRAIGVLMDVSETKRAQEEVRLREERLRLALEAGHMATWDWRIGSGEIAWNEDHYRILGYEPGEVRPSFEAWSARVHPEDLAETNGAMQASIEAGGEYSQSYRLLLPDGSVRWVSARGRLERDATGTATRSYGVVWDLTDAKRAQLELSESEARFRAVAETVPEYLYSTTAEGRCDFASPNFLRYTGLSLEQGLQGGWFHLGHPDDVDIVKQKWNDALRSGTAFHAEWRLRGKDGSYRWFVDRAIPLRDEQGQTIRWFGACTDIQELKETEQRLRRANQDIAEMTYAVAHDLREPLRNVSISSEILLQLPELKENQAAGRAQGIIFESVQRMDALLKDMLDYAHATQTGRLTATTCDTAVALDQALSNLTQTISEAGARIEAGALPVVRGSEAHFVRLFQNFIGNGIKYRSAEKPHITVTAEDRTSNWLFAIRDNGIGIEPEYHRYIFGMFKRLHARSIPGTGIGLAICSKIIEGNGGDVWVASELGKGSTFYFTWPKSPAPL